MKAQKPSRSFGCHTWIAVRFLLFACGGLVALLFGTVNFVLRIFDHDLQMVTPFLSLPIICTSLFMLLYGTSQWGRWRYLIVFISMPISFFVPIFLFWLLTDTIVPWPIPFIMMGFVGFLAHAAVRRYYSNHEDGLTDESAAQHKDRPNNGIEERLS
jgi:hypothetical protein